MKCKGYDLTIGGVKEHVDCKHGEPELTTRIDKDGKEVPVAYCDNCSFDKNLQARTNKAISTIALMSNLAKGKNRKCTGFDDKLHSAMLAITAEMDALQSAIEAVPSAKARFCV